MVFGARVPSSFLSQHAVIDESFLAINLVAKEDQIPALEVGTGASDDSAGTQPSSVASYKGRSGTPSKQASTSRGLPGVGLDPGCGREVRGLRIEVTALRAAERMRTRDLAGIIVPQALRVFGKHSLFRHPVGSPP
jgi:hypothetical protein